MSDPRDAIAAIIRDQTGQVDLPAPDADLLDALNIDGDDVSDLMQAFAIRFHVDLSGYRWFYHHGPEGFSLIPSRFWGNAFEMRRIPITLALLEHAATLGKWPVTYPDLPETEKAYDSWERRGKARLFLALFAFLCLLGLQALIR